MDRKFLTVMAVLDDATQNIFGNIQSRLTEEVGEGTQTTGIPFHITLGSYPTDCESELIEKIRRVVSDTCAFDIQLTGYNHFSHKVFYVEPQISDRLLAQRRQFENDYAHSFEWQPHVTLYCGDEERVMAAMQAVPKLDFPMTARVVGIELGEFFPPRQIVRADFNDKD